MSSLRSEAYMAPELRWGRKMLRADRIKQMIEELSA